MKAKTDKDLDPTICPRCGASNACAIARPTPTNQETEAHYCWCMQEPVAANVFKQNWVNSCYCQKCLQELKTEQSHSSIGE